MKVNFLQEGGPMPAEQAPQDPMQELVAMAAQAVQSNDPNLAMQVCQGLVQMAEQAAQAQAAPGGMAPEEEPAGEPVFKQGGILARRLK